MTAIDRHSAPQSLWMLAAGLSFALMAQCVKVSLETMGVAELTLYRSLGGAVILYVLMRVRGQNVRLRHYRLHFWRGAWGLVAIMLFYWSIHLLPTSIAYALNYTAPLFFIVLTSIVLHERPHPLTVTALVGSFCGVLLLLRPDTVGASFTGSVAGIVSGMCVGVAFLMIRRLGHHGETGLRTVFFFNLHGTAFAALLLLVLGGHAGIDADNVWPVLGVFAFASSGQIALTRALHRGTSDATAGLYYCGVLFSLAIDAIATGTRLALADYLGVVMIVSFGGYALWLTRDRAKPVAQA